MMKDRKLAKEKIKALIELIEPESAEHAERVQQKLDIAEAKVCKFGFGDREASKLLLPMPIGDFQFEDGPTVYQWMPGEVYEKKHQGGNYCEIRTPALSDDEALVLAPDCLNAENFAKVSGWIASVAGYCDVYVICKKYRITQDELNSIKSTLSITECFQNGRPMPVLLLQSMEGLDPEEAEKLYNANYSSLENITPVEAGYKCYSSGEDDAEFQELKSFLRQMGERLHQEQEERLLADVIALEEEQHRWLEERAKFYGKHHDERLDYDERSNRIRALNKVIGEPTLLTKTQRALNDVFDFEQETLEDEFLPTEINGNGGATLYTAAFEHLSNCKTPAEFDRGNYQAFQILSEGYVGTLNSVYNRINYSLPQIFEDVIHDLNDQLKAAGASDLPQILIPTLELTVENGVEVRELNPKSLPKTPEKVFRYGIGFSLGGGLPITLVKTLVDVKVLAATTIITAPVSLAVLFFVGAGVGVVMTFYMIRDAKRRSYLNDGEKKTRDTVIALGKQANRALRLLKTSWTRALEDGVRDLKIAASQHVEDEMLRLKSVSGMSASELAERRAHYENLSEELGEILTELKSYRGLGTDK